METSVILERLEELLEEERLGIRKLLGPRIEVIAREKLDLMRRLDAAPDVRSGTHTARVKEVVRRLRHNSVLLVHARSILVEAVRIKRARFASPVVVAAPAPMSPERHISVMG